MRPAPLATNAPQWPPVYVQLDPENEGQNALFVVTQLNGIFEKMPGTEVVEVLRRAVTPDGIVEIPIVVSHRGKEVPIFIFPEANKTAGGQFAWAFAWAKMNGYPMAIYYAPTPLQKAAPVPHTRPFLWDVISKSKTGPARAYAWWPTEAEPNWKGSKVQRSMVRAFKALRGYESAMFGILAKEMRLVEKARRIDLPDSWSQSVKGPGAEEFFVSASLEKGIQFHFDSDRCDPMYRDVFWSCYADTCEEFAQFWKKNADKDKQAGYTWFKFMNSTMEKMEKQGGVGKVSGLITA